MRLIANFPNAHASGVRLNVAVATWAVSRDVGTRQRRSGTGVNRIGQ
jgi:hypothetical protein